MFLQKGKMDYFVNILVLGISTSLVFSINVGAVNANGPQQPCNFPAIYNFGGSNSDTGSSLSAALYPITAPNGRTFFKEPAGRACDGRLVIDFIAEHLKLPYLSAYLNSMEPNFEHGANFATIEAPFYDQWNTNESIWVHGLSPFTVDVQVNSHFDQFKNRTIALYNQGKDISALPKPEDFSKALYTFDIGHTDLSVSFLRLENEIKVREFIPVIINKFADYVQSLYSKGGRTFWIQNAGPIGCMPNTTLGISKPMPGILDQNGCVKSRNDVARELNKQLRDRVIKLRTQLPDAALTYVDFYAAAYDLISNAKDQGFTDPMKICCGFRKKGEYVKCGKEGKMKGKKVFAGSCENPSKFISWDGIHYTEAANCWIANRLISGSLSDPPIPIIQACRKI